jgi:hypothetical protein
MAATHDVHRFIEENLFGSFSRPTTTNNNNNFRQSYRSLTASDLLSQRSSGSTSRISSFPQQYKCRPASETLQARTNVIKASPEGIHTHTHILAYLSLFF